MTPETTSPNIAPSKRWAIMRRALKFSLLGFLGAVICVTLVTWVRSYHDSDRVQGTLGGDWCFLIGSKQGCVACVAFDTERRLSQQFEIDWATKDYPIDHPLAYPNAEAIDASGKLKMGLIRQVHYSFWSDKSFTISAPRGTAVTFQGLTLIFTGGGLIVPHWLILLVSSTLFALIILKRRFTLREFMLWVTLVCVLLGNATRIDSPAVQPDWKMNRNE